MNGRCVVITGTDTGVGKTHVGCALAYALVERGVQVQGIKPIESGCAQLPSHLEDGAKWARATGQNWPTRALCRLEAPVAPPVAADAEGVALDFEALVSRTREEVEKVEFTFVEGAGGLLSPLTWEATTLDIARGLNAPILIVAKNILGSLNQIRLTHTVCVEAGISVVGVALVTSDGGDVSSASNEASVRRLLPDLPVWNIPWNPDARDLGRGLSPLLEVMLS
jgi:dethiobiotin synthetase